MAFNPIEIAPKNEDFTWVRKEGEPRRLTPTHCIRRRNVSSVPSSSNLRRRDEEKALPLRRFGLHAAVFVTAGLAVLFPAFIGDFEPASSHHIHRAGETSASTASVPAQTVLSQDVASAELANLNVRTVSEAPPSIETAKAPNIEQKQGFDQARLGDDAVVHDPASGRQDIRAAAPPLGAIEDQIALWVKRGEDLIAVGDFVSARVLFQRAADMGDAQAALMLAATFDPHMLNRLRAKGLTVDIAKARRWYEKAWALGSPAAARRLELLAQPRR